MQYSIDQNDFVSLKKRLLDLSKTNKVIHVDISQKRKKMTNVQAKIEGIYDRFMCVTSMVNSYSEDFTISYIDLLTNKIKIKELE